VAQDTALVIDHVAIAAADPHGLLDHPVEPLCAGVGHGLGERDRDRRPPCLDVRASLVVSGMAASIAAS
jgi:hypothetical protein